MLDDESLISAPEDNYAAQNRASSISIAKRALYRRKALFLPAIECGRCSGVSEDLGHIERRGLPLRIFNNVHVLGVVATL